jgi:regulatory protein YycI of two-component signal transduction system YycFG
MIGMNLFVVIFIILFLFLNYNYYKEKRRQHIEEKRQETLLLDDFFYHKEVDRSWKDVPYYKETYFMMKSLLILIKYFYF